MTSRPIPDEVVEAMSESVRLASVETRLYAVIGGELKSARVLTSSPIGLRKLLWRCSQHPQLMVKRGCWVSRPRSEWEQAIDALRAMMLGLGSPGL